ncbi:MAG TPA: hypothetical protein DCS88_00785 [Alphaproteobacteria bacterium]|nr:hypothetical protein [Alphaproteobacteria bacterium]
MGRESSGVCLNRVIWGLIPVIETTKRGMATLEIDYKGKDSISIQYLGGGSPSHEYLGAREEQRIEVVQFNGDETVPFNGEGTPSILESTDFVNAKGQTVNRPLFRSLGDKKEFYAAQRVWGGMVISYTRHFRVYRIEYDVEDQRYSDNNAFIREDIPPIHIFVRAGLSMANTSLSRSVQWPENNIIREKPTKNMRKAEIERAGNVWRIFPQLGNNSQPIPDWQTGRTDYSDVEQTTRIVYGVFEEDEHGHAVIVRDIKGYVINALEIITETYQSEQPPNSRRIDSFYRKTG